MSARRARGSETGLRTHGGGRRLPLRAYRRESGRKGPARPGPLPAYGHGPRRPGCSPPQPYPSVPQQDAVKIPSTSQGRDDPSRCGAFPPEGDIAINATRAATATPRQCGWAPRPVGGVPANCCARRIRMSQKKPEKCLDRPPGPWYCGGVSSGRSCVEEFMSTVRPARR